jgi:hypothetical protein
MQLDIDPVAGVMVPSRVDGSVHIPGEAARSNVFSVVLLNQMEVTINDDEARNKHNSEWAATPFRS